MDIRTDTFSEMPFNRILILKCIGVVENHRRK
jgi:hypothetical protein